MKPCITDFTKKTELAARTRVWERTKCKNLMMVPRLQKVVVHISVGSREKIEMQKAREVLWIITHQRPCPTFAKKSESNFRIKAGMQQGWKVTLRGDLKYNFLMKTVAGALPANMEFNGIDESSVQNNALSFGMSSVTVYPEHSGIPTR